MIDDFSHWVTSGCSGGLARLVIVVGASGGMEGSISYIVVSIDYKYLC